MRSVHRTTTQSNFPPYTVYICIPMIGVQPLKKYDVYNDYQTHWTLTHQASKQSKRHWLQLLCLCCQMIAHQNDEKEAIIYRYYVINLWVVVSLRWPRGQPSLRIVSNMLKAVMCWPRNWDLSLRTSIVTIETTRNYVNHKKYNHCLWVILCLLPIFEMYFQYNSKNRCSYSDISCHFVFKILW